ncbi:D-glycero-beta-D-manno-heptose 1,7-bisphosphate 7-phosphatase [Polynucleobacter sp. HIN11]|uniref:D-glycero-beta-D-manno-heptose 1,7-bisphosphate 7-phosphatase n=1 Tax=Polynucleobacter sp. HIN11 TaxID=3047870 RepID=UPI002573081C|nr:D-glycero-beta-D-manno-heptose 1,7-bisphosphate 7-phosphatase [Polynucleobacter sp. HIN11]BEI45199.1 D-glycero-beta-D-manno-heptose 1,7-bisphosphate 7-phosphatase [Polynucleobacter sp. HIN11]
MTVKVDKLIILDRDGVINQDRDDYVKSCDEWIPIPNSLEAIALLSQAGYTLTIATNQSGIARGYYSLNELHAMHQKMMDLLKPLSGRIDSIFFCPHTDADHCDCRKPKPGLMQQIANRYLKSPANPALPLSNVPLVGDSLRDLLAGTALGASPHLVLTGKGRDVNRAELPNNAQIHEDLMGFAQSILAQS